MMRGLVLASLALAVHGLAVSKPAPRNSGATRVETFTRRQALFATGAGALALASPQSTFAQETAAAGGFQGVYADPKHPKGYRVVRESKPGVALIELRDDPDGEVFTVTGATTFDKKTDATTIKIDFSVKGGPKDVPGVYSAGKLSFPDGNVWSKL